MPINILPLSSNDQSLLWDFLFQAIFTPAGEIPPSRAKLDEPEIAHYAAEWGKVGDMGFKAVEDEIPIGAAWLRLIDGYGHVADDIPELTISVLPAYRGRGIGTALLLQVINSASRQFRGISLSVMGANPAIHLYERFGFRIVKPDGGSYTMLRRMDTDEQLFSK